MTEQDPTAEATVPEPSPEATTEATPTDAAPAPTEADLPPAPSEPVPDPETNPGPPAEPKQVRIVPADWTVDSVQFTTGENEDAVQHVITADKPGNVPYLVGEDEADDVITVAAQCGLAVTKGPSA